MRLVMSESQYNFSKGWKLKDGKLSKKFTFGNYASVINFVNKIADISEDKNHHPEMIVKINSVEVIFFDHKEKKVSDKCHKMANLINSL
jgi:4a-hydroxytetrahydrobiopterin dehydratase